MVFRLVVAPWDATRKNKRRSADEDAAQSTVGLMLRAPAAGHPGRSKSLELLSRNYYWSEMRYDVETFVRNCHTCQRSKTSRHAPFGTLRPLPIPQQPWQDISIDFVTGLPGWNGHDAIWVVVDRLTKQRHLVPCRMTVDARDLALQNVFWLHGLPLIITSDRGPQFASAFWHRLCARLGVEPRLSTAFHPQTDGQTERMIAVMEQYLGAYVNYLQGDWAEWLPLAEFSSNNHTSETTATSPFFANLGYDPADNLTSPPQHHVNPTTSAPVPPWKRYPKFTTTRGLKCTVPNYSTRGVPMNIAVRPQIIRRGTSCGSTLGTGKRNDHRRNWITDIMDPSELQERLLRTPTNWSFTTQCKCIRSSTYRYLNRLLKTPPLPGQRQPAPPPVEIDGEQG